MPEEPLARVHITIPVSGLVEIDDWRFANKIPTRAEAIRRLIDLGLKAEPAKPKKGGR